MKLLTVRLVLADLLLLGLAACTNPAPVNQLGPANSMDIVQDADAVAGADSSQDSVSPVGHGMVQDLDVAADLGATGGADGGGTGTDGGGCPAGSPCDDGNKCTTGDSCVNGKCVGVALDCAKGLTQCKTGKCDPGSGLCVIGDKASTCDDGDPCTQGDFCVAGGCIGYKKEGCCTVNCTAKKCGDDGCGGSCGECGNGEVCG